MHLGTVLSVTNGLSEFSVAHSVTWVTKRAPFRSRAIQRRWRVGFVSVRFHSKMVSARNDMEIIFTLSKALRTSAKSFSVSTGFRRFAARRIQRATPLTAPESTWIKMAPLCGSVVDRLIASVTLDVLTAEFRRRGKIDDDVRL